MRTLLLLISMSAVLGGTPAAMPQSPGSAPPLADPPGITSTVNISTVAQLDSAIAGLVSNRKIVVAAGTYAITSTLWFPGGLTNVVVRGATGNRNDVVIKGPGMADPSVPHGIWVGDATNVLIADLSVGNVYYHPVALQPPSGADSIRLYNCRIFDAGEQLIKSNPGGSGPGVSNGRVEYCVLEYTTTAPSDYTNGVDVHRGADWQIRHCLFRNIRAPSGYPLAGPSILMWNGSSNTLVEGNTFLNCERGVALGLIQRTGFTDHTGGIVRNNIFYRASGESGDVGIQVADGPGAKVINNTVICSGTYGTPIEYRFATTTGTLIANNLIDGTIWARDGATGTETTNTTSATPSMFVNASAGDFHLVSTAAAAIDQGSTQASCLDDWDGWARPVGAAYDIGADEYGNSPSTPPPSPPSGGGGGGRHRGGGCFGAAGSAGYPAWLALGLLVLLAAARRR